MTQYMFLLTIMVFLLSSQVHAFTSVCDRSVTMRNVLVNQFQKPCNQITKKDLDSIQRLWVYGGREPLQDNDLEDFLELEFLNLEVATEALPENLLRPLPSLKVFSSSDLPYLRSIPERFFSESYALTNVSIGFAPLVRELPQGLLSSLRSLKVFSFYAAGLESIRADLFAQNPILSWVNLSSNKISEVPADLFSNNHWLKELSIDSNRISEVPLGLFSNNRKLKILGLQYNPINLLRAEVIDGLDALDDLRVDHDALASNTLAAARQLKSLDIRVHFVKDLSATFLSGNPQLEVLRIAVSDTNYQDDALDKNLLLPVPSLKAFVLDGGYRVTIPDNFFKTSQAFEAICLRDMKLQYLPKGMFSGLMKPRERYGWQVSLQGNNFSDAEKARIVAEVGDRSQVQF